MFRLSLATTPPDAGDSLLLPLPTANPRRDPLEQLQAAERTDWLMLRLVLCSATATLVMGLAGSLIG